MTTSTDIAAITAVMKFRAKATSVWPFNSCQRRFGSSIPVNGGLARQFLSTEVFFTLQLWRDGMKMAKREKGVPWTTEVYLPRQFHSYSRRVAQAEMAFQTSFKFAPSSPKRGSGLKSFPGTRRFFNTGDFCFCTGM